MLWRVDELGQVGGGAEDVRGRARRRRSRPAPARTRDGWRACARAGGRWRRRPRSACAAARMTFGNSHVRTTPRSVGTSTIARPRKMNASTRRVDEHVEALLQALAEHEQRQRAGEQRVEERRHLVEALARDRPRLALVEPVGAEDRRATTASWPAPAATSSQVGAMTAGGPIMLGQHVRAGERDQDRHEVGAEQEPDATAREAAPPTGRRVHRGRRDDPQPTLVQRLCVGGWRPSAQDASRSCWITRSCM